MKKNIEYIKTQNANTSEDIRAEIKKFRDERLVKEEEQEQEQEQQQNQEQNNVIIFRYLFTLMSHQCDILSFQSPRYFFAGWKNVKQIIFN
jgi:hypothetical protein